MDSIVAIIKAELAKQGVDICESFEVARYNALVKRFPLPTFDKKNALALVFGSTKAVWPHFEAYIRDFEEDESVPKDPVDSFHEYVIATLFSTHPELSKLQYEARYDWNTPRTGKFVHVQSAGHVAGFAYYDQESGWSCHPEYGFWFVYRGVIVLDVEWEGPSPPEPTPAISAEVRMEISKWTEIANSERWQNRATRLHIRDACPIGKEKYRYDGECMKYFFPIEEPAQAVIDRIRKKPANSSSDSPYENEQVSS